MRDYAEVIEANLSEIYLRLLPDEVADAGGVPAGAFRSLYPLNGATLPGLLLRALPESEHVHRFQKYLRKRIGIGVLDYMLDFLSPPAYIEVAEHSIPPKTGSTTVETLELVDRLSLAYDEAPQRSLLSARLDLALLRACDITWLAANWQALGWDAQNVRRSNLATLTAVLAKAVTPSVEDPEVDDAEA